MSWLWLFVPVAVGCWILRLPFRQPKVFGPLRCKRCRYLLIGIPRKICPECGADLNVIGVTTRDGYLPPTTTYLCAAWTLFCLFAILIPIAAVFEALRNDFAPRQFSITGNYSFSSRTHWFYASWFAGNVGFHPANPQTLIVRLSQPGLESRDLILDASDHREDTLKKIKAWMQASRLKSDGGDKLGFDLEAEGVQLVAHTIFTTPPDRVDHRISFPRQLGMYRRGSSINQQANQLPYTGLIPVVFVGGIWAIGLHRIYKYHFTVRAQRTEQTASLATPGGSL